MPVDPVIQAYIDQLHELTSAANEAKKATQGTGQGGGVQPVGTRPQGDNSLGAPSEPLSQTVAKQALINQFTFKSQGGGSQTLGPAASTPDPSVPVIIPARPGMGFRGDGILLAPPTMNDVYANMIGNKSTNVGRAIQARDLDWVTADQSPFIPRMQSGGFNADQSPGNPISDRYRKFGRLGQGGKAFIQTGYRTDLGSVSAGGLPSGTPVNPRALKWISSNHDPGAWGQNQAPLLDSEAWAELQQSALGARRADQTNQLYQATMGGDKALAIARRNMLNQRLFGEQSVDQFLFGGGKGPTLTDWVKGLTPTYQANKALIGKALGYAGTIAAVATEGYESVRSLQFEKYSVERMSPGLARSKATMQFEQDRNDAIRNNVTHTLAAAAFVTGLGIPIAAAIEGVNYAWTATRDFVNKQYNEKIFKEAGIEDLVRKYSLGDTNIPATQRAKEFENKFQTAEQFKALLSEAQDNISKGYQRIGLGDFRASIAQQGGVGFLNKGAALMKGIQPMWFNALKIYSQLDSSRLAVRQFAATNTKRAANRTGQ